MNPKGIPSNYVKNAQGEYCHPSRVGGLLPTQPKRDTLPALDQKPKARRSGKVCVALRVTFVRFSSHLLDDDNLQAAYKGLRDGVAKSFGIDDADKRIRFEYGQCETRGATGTVVKIEQL